MLELIRLLPAYQDLLSRLSNKIPVTGLALLRSARLPLIATLQEDLKQPILLITDRVDHALTFVDELKFWSRWWQLPAIS